MVEWIEKLSITKSLQTKRFLSASTIRHHIGAARKLFKWLIKSKHYTKLNPCNHEDVIDTLPVLDNEKIVFLTEEKKNLILEYIQGLDCPYIRGTFYGYLLSSFRTSDLFSINEDDLDFERCLVRLRDTKRDKRIVAVSEAFMQLCKELIALKRKESRSFEYDQWDDDPEEHKKAIFITSRGRRRKSFRTQLKTCLRYADIPYDDPETSFTPHSFRHNFATYTLSLSGNMNTTAAALYHTDMKSTQRYAHTIQDNVHTAVNATASHILGGETPENLLQTENHLKTS
jgi:site-specific recombinase XerD